MTQCLGTRGHQSCIYLSNLNKTMKIYLVQSGISSRETFIIDFPDFWGWKIGIDPMQSTKLRRQTIKTLSFWIPICVTIYNNKSSVDLFITKILLQLSSLSLIFEEFQTNKSSKLVLPHEGTDASSGPLKKNKYRNKS